MVGPGQDQPRDRRARAERDARRGEPGGPRPSHRSGTATEGRPTFQVNGKKWKGAYLEDLKVGTKVWLAAPLAQTRKGQRWVFVGWSDGGRRIHRIVIGDRRVDLKAVYRRA